jgi:hypothetical protein
LTFKSTRASTLRNEVTVMVRKLFESFLEDPEQYRAVEQYWEALVADIAESMNQANEWHRWMPIRYADGIPLEEPGNPISDGRSDALNRAFRIIQLGPPGDDVEIAAWVTSYKPEDTALPRHELVINLGLTQESADLARLLLQKWMRRETTAEDMKNFIYETSGVAG